MQQSIDLHPCFPSERQQCGQNYYESEFDAEILGIKHDLFCTFYAHPLKKLNLQDRPHYIYLGMY